MKEFPPVNELIDKGEWKYFCNYSKGLIMAKYFIEKSNNGRYRSVYIHSVNKKGYIILGSLRLFLKSLRRLFNIMTKELGNYCFDEIIDELDELFAGFNNTLSSGKTYAIRGRATREECIEDIRKEIERVKSK